MWQARYKRLGWLAVLGLAGASYAACAWLWAAPYRAAPSGTDERAPLLLPAADRSLSNASGAAGASGAVGASDAQGTEAAPGDPLAAPSDALPPVVALGSRTPSLKNTRNFLLIGLDRRADGTGAALADTLIAVVLDERSSHVGLVSVPRDLYVDIPEAGTDRINTVYALARRTKRDPLELLRRVVEDTLKLPIEHALAIDLGVFERAVDAVGGVSVEVPCAIRDRFLDSRVEGGRRVLDLDPGRRQLDGATAAMYARSRHGRSDWNRARRQQAVLFGLRASLAGAGVLHLPELWTRFESSIETDMKRIELLALGRRALDVAPEHLHGLVLGHGHSHAFRTAEGKAVLLPDYPAIDAALSQLFSAPSPGTRPALARCEPKDAALNEPHAPPARPAAPPVTARR